MENQGLTITSQPERRRCPKGHLLAKHHRTFCATCRKQEVYRQRRAAGMDYYAASGRKRETSLKKAKRKYYKRRIEFGMTGREASYHTTTNSEAERAYLKRYRARWGDASQNSYDYFTRSIGRLLGLANREEVWQHIGERGPAVWEELKDLVTEIK